MKTTYSEKTFKCPNCKTVQKQYVWSDSDGIKCSNNECGGIIYMQDMVVPKKIKAAGIRTPTKNRV